MGSDERREKAARLGQALAKYRGGRFETGSSGGAGGMVFFRDAGGALYYIGGFNISDAQQIVTALNLALALTGDNLAKSEGGERPP